jgi:SAM-dependent methyltransferase
MMRILDIGPGVNPIPGAETLDSNPRIPATIRHDLNVFPYPIPDNTYDMIHTSHCLEHLQGNNAIGALEEIWRIAKPNARVTVRLPHYSGRMAWFSPEHVKPFGVMLFHHFDPATLQSHSSAVYLVRSVRLRWYSGSPGNPIYRIMDVVFSALANARPTLCERMWCYWVGGFDEVEYIVTAHKA